MNYQEQLNTAEWKAKREIILARDNYCCTKCNAKRSNLLNLSSKFGIKTLQGMKDEKYSIGSKFLTDRKLLCFKDGMLTTIRFVEEENLFNFEKLCFALQFTKSDSSVKPTYQLICFPNDTSNKYKFADLNVHHKYYIANKKAWEYKDDALITVCCECHKKIHETTAIPVYNEKGVFVHNADTCPKCQGSGYLPEYNYWQGGVCFDCGGHGVILQE